MTSLRPASSWLVRLGVLALGASLAPSAVAHLDMVAPPPREVGSSREPNSNLKQGPCGQVENGRTGVVSVYEPGETIEVRWTETINHRSYYRVAFDRDGDDAFPTFPGPGRGAQGIDPAGLCPVDGQVILAYELEDGQRETHTLRVTLPDVECERCTLQVVQYMFDANNPYYFQCADLALRRRPERDAGAAPERPDASTPDAGDLEPRAAPGCFTRISPLDAGRSDRGDDEPRREPGPPPPPAAAPASAPRAAVPPPLADDSERGPARGGGCSLEPSMRDAASTGWVWLALLVARARGWARSARASVGRTRGR